jgi:hypothetical protein
MIAPNTSNPVASAHSRVPEQTGHAPEPRGAAFNQTPACRHDRRARDREIDQEHEPRSARRD